MIVTVVLLLVVVMQVTASECVGITTSIRLEQIRKTLSNAETSETPAEAATQEELGPQPRISSPGWPRGGAGRYEAERRLREQVLRT